MTKGVVDGGSKAIDGGVCLVFVMAFWGTNQRQISSFV